MENGTEEEFVPEEESDRGNGALASLREKLKTAVAEKQEYLERWQRERADFVNFKREEAALMAEKEARIKAEVIESIIPALDTFELALKHAPSEDLSRVHKQLLQGLQQLGVERYGSVEDEFDPRTHEAIQQTETEEASEDYKIKEVQRSGYKIGDTVVRPAQVSILIHKK